MHFNLLKVSNFTSSHCKTTSRTFTAEEQPKDFGIKLTAELPDILNCAIQGCLDRQQQGLNPPQVVLDQVSAYKTEMDSIAHLWSRNAA